MRACLRIWLAVHQSFCNETMHAVRRTLSERMRSSGDSMMTGQMRRRAMMMTLKVHGCTGTSVPGNYCAGV